MKFSNLGLLVVCLGPKWWEIHGLWEEGYNISWLQYIIARRLLQKKKKKKKKRKKKKEKEIDNEIKKEEPKGDKYIVGPYLRQRVENL